MVYTAKTQKEFRMEGGSLSKKIASELALIDTDITALQAAGVGGTLTAGSVIVGNAGNVATDTVITGDIAINSSGVTSISSGVILNADVSSNAAIDYSKLAQLPTAQILVGSDASACTAVAVSGDIAISSAGVVSISSGVIVNADVSSNAAIAYSKLATLNSGNILVGSDASACTSVAMSGDATLNSTGVITIGAGKVTLANHVAASEDATVCKVLAEDAVIGGIPVTLMIGITASSDATLNTDIVTTHKIRVLDAHVILRGSGVGSETLTVQNAGNAITNAMDVSGSDTAVVRAGTINDSNYEIDAGGTLRVASAGGATRPAALVVVNAVRVA
jgi:hypothetical protein